LFYVGSLGDETDDNPQQSKQLGIDRQRLKRGPFTTGEDAYIRDYVKEWGDPKRQRGLWQKLKEVLKRPGM